MAFGAGAGALVTTETVVARSANSLFAELTGVVAGGVSPINGLSRSARIAASSFAFAVVHWFLLTSLPSIK